MVEIASSAPCFYLGQVWRSWSQSRHETNTSSNQRSARYFKVRYWRCPRSMRSMVGCPNSFVSSAVCLSHRSTAAMAAGGFAAERRLRTAGADVESRRRRLNTDLLWNGWCDLEWGLLMMLLQDVVAAAAAAVRGRRVRRVQLRRRQVGIT